MTRRAFLLSLCGTALVSGAAGRGRAAAARPEAPEGKRIMSADSEVLRSTIVEVGRFPVHMLESVLPTAADAPTVVLVHGLALSGQYMVPTAEQLAPHCKVYVPDFPGFGDSGKPSYVLNVSGLADALAAWMEAMNLERGVMLGNSFGCQIIAEFAVRHARKVERAILQGPTTDPDERSWFMQFVRWQQNSPHNPPKCRTWLISTMPSAVSRGL